MNTVWLGIGTNLGDRISHIDAAVKSLGGILANLKMASCYETAPRDFLNQPDFLNTVVVGTTSLEPLELLEKIHLIENEGGRTRSIDKGPRTIDIDILMYESIVRTFHGEYGSTLTLPHKLMGERLFVLKPLLDLDPDIVDPGDGVPWRIKASHLSEQRVKLYRK